MASKKKKEPDYTLNIFHHYDEKFKKNVVVFLVQTVKIFVSFRYEILIDSEIVDKKIKLRITGLHVPELLMPQTGPAQGQRDYENLSGIYNISIIKQDKTENECIINITGTTVEIKEKPKNAFILISTDPVVPA